MTFISPQTQAWLDQEDAFIADRIRRFGVAITAVGGSGCSHPGCQGPADERPFAYTIGLFDVGHPELVMVGLDANTAMKVLNSAARLVLQGERLMPGAEVPVKGWDRTVVAEEVPNPGDIAFVANRHYRRDDEVSVPLLQLTYSDRRGRMPWDDTYTGSRRRQPRPGAWDAR